MPATLPLAALLLASAASAQAPAAPRTLAEVFSRALAASESVAASEQSIRQAEAAYRRTFGGSLPELSLRHQSDWAQRAPAESQGMLRISQTGLTGYRELAALKGARATAAQRELERLRVEQLLLADVAAAFYGLLSARENSASTQELSELAGKRLSELRERVRVGRTREADAIAQEFQAEALRSQLEESARQEAAGADLLGYLIRGPVDPAAAAEPAPAPMAPLEAYLARLDSRPDVGAARKSLEAAEASLKIARSEHLPSVGLQANWYGYRPRARSDEHWDASAAVSLPLWSWGARRAGVESARAGLALEELALSAARRLGELEIRGAYRDHAAARRQLEIRRRAAALARRDYELQRRDESRGLVTSLEVLESLNRLNAARLSFNQALLDARLTAIGLELAAGSKARELDLK